MMMLCTGAGVILSRSLMRVESFEKVQSWMTSSLYSSAGQSKADSYPLPGVFAIEIDWHQNLIRRKEAENVDSKLECRCC